MHANAQLRIRRGAREHAQDGGGRKGSRSAHVRIVAYDAAMRYRMVLAATLCLIGAGCGGDKTPAPPSTGETPAGSTDEIQLRSGARIGWRQQAASASELESFQYAIYVDG